MYSTRKPKMHYDDVWAEEQLSIQVIEGDDWSDTGLLDANGNTIYRYADKLPVGYRCPKATV